jgi:hypothetical protein
MGGYLLQGYPCLVWIGVMMIFTGSGLVTPRDVFCRLYIPLQSPVAPLHMHVPHANFPGAYLHVEKLTS